MVSSAQRETGIVYSADGTPIHFDLYPVESPFLVIVVPGFWRNRRWPSMEILGSFLTDLGFQAAILDVRGHGDSGGTYTFNFLEHQDVYAVAQHLQQRLEVKAIGMIGFSIGGAIAVCTMSRHPDLPWRALALISPVAGFAMIRPSLNPLTIHRHLSARAAVRPPRFTWRFLRSRKLCAAEEIANVRVPVMVIHAKDDWLVHHRHGVLLHERANEPKELRLIETAGRYHADRLLIVAKDEVEDSLRDFLTRTFAHNEKAALARGF